MNGPRIGSLFSGSGQLDEGVRSVLGGSVAWHAEIEPAAVRVLDHRYPGVPNLGDVSTVDWATVEPVDVLTGGSPCQDLSHAGKRAGMTDGTRSNLWVVMREAVAQLRPSLVVWENVRGAYSACADSDMGRCPRCVDPDSTAGHAPLLRALGRVVGDLSSLGYLCRWHGLRAADVGAPHGRFRIFLIATDARRGPLARPAAAGDGVPVLAERRHGPAADARILGRDRGADVERGRRGQAVRGETRDHVGDPYRRAAADTDRDGLQGVGRFEPVGRDADRRGSADIAWGVYEPAIRRWEHLTRPAPAPTETGPKGGQRLSPRFTEWMQGWPDGWVTDVPGVTRNEALKLCGNGVVPQQAAEAPRRMLGGMVADASDVGALLPTPAAMNPNDGESLETWEARRQRVMLTANNGNGFGTPLSIAVQRLAGGAA